jgi:hypothetical protein
MKNKNKTIKTTRIKTKVKNNSNSKFLNKYNKTIKINYNFHTVNLKNNRELKVKNIFGKKKRK